ncbi:hypothetical protein QQF64_004987 [Cirrhinus molitorella]|uniref:Uncharacterized protein n=1 Tax=Cirrhinus molitorella TaxID=172907 RepID=A0ABR3MHU3_9TELE
MQNTRNVSGKERRETPYQISVQIEKNYAALGKALRVFHKTVQTLTQTKRKLRGRRRRGEGAERKRAVRRGEMSSYSKGTCEFVHELPLCTSPSCLNVSSLSHSHCKSSKESTQLKSLFPGNWALMAQGGNTGPTNSPLTQACRSAEHTGPTSSPRTKRTVHVEDT